MQLLPQSFYFQHHHLYQWNPRRYSVPAFPKLVLVVLLATSSASASASSLSVVTSFVASSSSVFVPSRLSLPVVSLRSVSIPIARIFSPASSSLLGYFAPTQTTAFSTTSKTHTRRRRGYSSTFTPSTTTIAESRNSRTMTTTTRKATTTREFFPSRRQRSAATPTTAAATPPNFRQTRSMRSATVAVATTGSSDGHSRKDAGMLRPKKRRGSSVRLFQHDDKHEEVEGAANVAEEEDAGPRSSTCTPTATPSSLAKRRKPGGATKAAAAPTSSSSVSDPMIIPTTPRRASSSSTTTVRGSSRNNRMPPGAVAVTPEPPGRTKKKKKKLKPKVTPKSKAKTKPKSKPKTKEKTKATNKKTKTKTTNKNKKTKNKSSATTTWPEPEGWRDIYELVRELRHDQTAPCDIAGAEALTLPPPSFSSSHDDTASSLEVYEKTRRFQTLIALMLSSQTKDAMVAKAMYNLREVNADGTDGLTVHSILAMDADVLNAKIYSVGFRNNKTKYIKQVAEILHDQYDDDIPGTAADMITDLPGVGPKMAYIVENICWGIQTGIGVDTHMQRLFPKLGWTDGTTPEQIRKHIQSWLPPSYWGDVNLLWVGFGQEVQQEKQKIFRKVLVCSRPVDGLRLLKLVEFDLEIEWKKLQQQQSMLQQVDDDDGNEPVWTLDDNEREKFNTMIEEVLTS